MSAYYLKDEQFIIENYDKQKPFASFLPGVAGTNGIPMWVYYTNRGQGIAGFGIENKDGSILDFVPANQSYRRTETIGFRTFIKKDGEVHEIFSSSSRDDVTRKMIIEANSVGYEECHMELDLCVNVKYFTVTEQPYPGLIRKVTLKSLSGNPVEVEVLDGLMTLWPYGNENASIKDMSNLAVAWFEVYNAENHLPFYRNRSTTNDSAAVGMVEAGHFFAAFSNVTDGPLPVIYDPEIIFGFNTGLTRADNFETQSIKALLEKDQISANKIPCAYLAFEGRIEGEVVLTSVIGKMNHVDTLNAMAVDFSNDYFLALEQSALDLGQSLTKDVAAKTAFPTFDAYIKQSFLDNLLRGGYPVVFEGRDGPIVYHVYSRIHGDMEREYNNFFVEAAYYSQGIGAFRDVNQNRRNDVYFVKDAGLYNVKQFMELIQLDGQNPLSIQGSKLKMDQSAIDTILELVTTEKEVVLEVLISDFTPGKLLTTLDDYKVALTVSRDTFLEKVMLNSTQEIQAAYGHGYWVDHWTYNMDLIENYLNVYPENEEKLLFEEEFRYFLSEATVLPRNDKYVLTSDGKVRQYDAVIIDPKRVAKLGIKKQGTNWLKTENGDVFKSSLFVKLFSLVMNKMTSMDPSGIGVMMNTDKPGWNDAMNGLPGLFGSGTSETIELIRIVEFLLGSMKYGRDVEVPIELAEMILAYESQILNGNVIDHLIAYAEAQTFKEIFNRTIHDGISGELTHLEHDLIDNMLMKILKKLESAVEKAIEIGGGIMPSYLVHEAIDYKVINDKYHPINNLPNVKVKSWKMRSLPLYLEAPARYLNDLKSVESAKRIYDHIKKSGMYDEALGMYMTSESLEAESLEIGRARAFTAGWLERESVFMHMEYKYLLGLLKSGLRDEFFTAIKTALPPFMNPEVYGRSTLENSSFIASSRNPNPSNHGRGFVSRLTGTTSEMMTMYLEMMTGLKIFTMKEDNLCFALNPVLSADFFDENNEVRFTLFGQIKVTYKNPKMKATYGDEGVKVCNYKLTYVTGEIVEMTEITGQAAQNVRDCIVNGIEAELY